MIKWMESRAAVLAQSRTNLLKLNEMNRQLKWSEESQIEQEELITELREAKVFIVVYLYLRLLWGEYCSLTCSGHFRKRLET